LILELYYARSEEVLFGIIAGSRPGPVHDVGIDDDLAVTEYRPGS
jgi:hypothetical protein